MYGNQLVTSTSIFTVGYVIGQIPSNLLLTRISPRWVIPAVQDNDSLCCDTRADYSYSLRSDGVLLPCVHLPSSHIRHYTPCASSSAYLSITHKALMTLHPLIARRSGFYPGIHYLLGSWYTPQELGKRAMVFWLAGSIGQLFSGFLQAAAYTNLNGVSGLAGWRWLFIIDGIITLPLALAGFLFFPNLPQGGKRTWWTTEKEHELSIKRMQAIGRAGKEPWTRAKVKRLLLSWHTYFLPLLYVIWNNGGPQPAMGFWLKSFNKQPNPVPGTHFTVPQINNLPLLTSGLFIIMSLIWGWLSDGPCRGARWPFIYAGAIITLAFSIAMRQMPLYSDIEGRKIVYWLSQLGFGAGPLILSWVNEICSDDTEKRALLVAAGNDLAYVVQAVAPNFVWKTTDFPRARKGYTWSIVLQVLLVLHTAAIQLLLWRDKKTAARRELAEPLDSPALNSNDWLADTPSTNGKTVVRSTAVPAKDLD